MKKVTFVAIIALVFIACQKNDSPLVDETITNTFMPLNVGNYWIYQAFQIDSAGNEIEAEIYDSVAVTKTEVILGETFYFVEEFSNYLKPDEDNEGRWWNWKHSRYLRDSIGYIVSNYGEVSLSVNNFEDILENIEYKNSVTDELVYTVTYKMENVGEDVKVPAGNFKVIDFQGTLTTPIVYPDVNNPRYVHSYYAENVGQVKENVLYVSSNKGMGRKLVRYHVVY